MLWALWPCGGLRRSPVTGEECVFSPDGIRLFERCTSHVHLQSTTMLHPMGLTRISGQGFSLVLGYLSSFSVGVGL